MKLQNYPIGSFIFESTDLKSEFLRRFNMILMQKAARIGTSWQDGQTGIVDEKGELSPNSGHIHVIGVQGRHPNTWRRFTFAASRKKQSHC